MTEYTNEQVALALGYEKLGPEDAEPEVGVIVRDGEHVYPWRNHMRHVCESPDFLHNFEAAQECWFALAEPQRWHLCRFSQSAQRGYIFEHEVHNAKWYGDCAAQAIVCAFMAERG